MVFAISCERFPFCYFFVMWVFLLWIGVLFTEKELVGSHNNLWAIFFLSFFHDVRSVLWVARLFVVNGCLVSRYSPDLFSVEGLIVRCRLYLQCARLCGYSWESVGLVQLDGILVDFAWDNNDFFIVSFCFEQV